LDLEEEFFSSVYFAQDSFYFYFLFLLNVGRYPDEEAGEVPMAFVVRQPRSILGGPEIMDFVAKQVPSNSLIISN
jgi:hypothetical protein